MCSHYEAPTPGYLGPFLRRSTSVGEMDDEGLGLEVRHGSFGLIPQWSKDTKICRRTYNARSETVAEKPSYRNAWRRAQHCIIPAAAIYEPDWRSGKAVATRIARADGELMGIAGLWEEWRDPNARQVLHSFTMLTVNADTHEFMRNYHRPEDEKRMVVILPRRLYSDWLKAPVESSADFMRRYPADRLAVVERT